MMYSLHFKILSIANLQEKNIITLRRTIYVLELKKEGDSGAPLMVKEKQKVLRGNRLKSKWFAIGLVAVGGYYSVNGRNDKWSGSIDILNQGNVIHTATSTTPAPTITTTNDVVLASPPNDSYRFVYFGIHNKQDNMTEYYWVDGTPIDWIPFPNGQFPSPYWGPFTIGGHFIGNRAHLGSNGDYFALWSVCKAPSISF
uniref:Uncharacterized protein n=1 Tax=Acrobeloides nanus TaxID=290746 RepID=A0A914CQY8_9BILA